MGAKSTVAKASTKSTSVRTTVPEHIAKELELSVGDVLDWQIDFDHSRKVAKVKKLV